MKVTRRQSLKTLAAAAALPAGTAAAQGERATKPPLRLVVLDIGGTLIEDHGEVPEAMRSAFAHKDFEVSFAEIGDWRGAS